MNNITTKYQKVDPSVKSRPLTKRRRTFKRVIIRYDLYLMLLLPITWYIIFQYVPMYGLQIAFKDFHPAFGFLGSEWVGFENFERFFSSYYFGRLIWNTLSISIYSLLVAFPIPIFLALLINEIQSAKLKKWIQNVTYMPHFISVVVIVGMLSLFLNPSSGFLNIILNGLGLESIAFMEESEWFKTIFIGSNIWQNMGWQSIIYIAALSGIDPQLYEAAKIDGATRLQRVLHVSLPSIFPVIIILLILDIGHFMNVGFEKILLMQNSLNLESSEVIQTFIYKNGILNGDFSYSTAIGLFNSIINFALLILVNRYARKKAETSLW